MKKGKPTATPIDDAAPPSVLQRIRYRATHAGSAGCWQPGMLRELPDVEAAALVAGGYAELVETAVGAALPAGGATEQADNASQVPPTGVLATGGEASEALLAALSPADPAPPADPVPPVDAAPGGKGWPRKGKG